MKINGIYLLGFGILDFLWRKKIPITVEAASLLLYIVDKDAVGSIWADDKGIYMSELVSLTRYILLDQVVCSVVVENCMHFLGAVSTDIWPKHDAVNQTNS